MAQVDLRRAGADTAAVRRIAEVARVVELGAEAATGLGRRCSTSLIELRPVFAMSSWSTKTIGASWLSGSRRMREQ